MNKVGMMTKNLLHKSAVRFGKTLENVNRRNETIKSLVVKRLVYIWRHCLLWGVISKKKKRFENQRVDL